MISEKKFYESISINLLNYFGNTKPNQEQIKYMESLVANVWLKRTLAFNDKLSEREKACLYFVSQGNNTYRTAKLLGISVNTVKTHKKEIMRKLLCKNMAQAVSVGIKYGIISTS